MYTPLQEVKRYPQKYDDPKFRESLENYVLHSSRDSYLYARYYIKGRWPKGEKVIIKCPYSSIGYTCEVLKTRWREAEDIIMSKPGSAVGYARTVLKKRWREAEDIIITDMESSLAYVRKVIRGPWYRLEEKFIRLLEMHPDRSTLNSLTSKITLYLKYSQVDDLNVKTTLSEKSTFVDTLRDFCKDHTHLVFRFLDISKETSYPEAEYLIKDNITLLDMYIRYYRKDPWPEAEPKIATEALLSFFYAKNILKGRFPEGEVILTKSPYKDQYIEFLKTL